jgi:hypothetical protein
VIFLDEILPLFAARGEKGANQVHLYINRKLRVDPFRPRSKMTPLKSFEFERRRELSSQLCYLAHSEE